MKTNRENTFDCPDNIHNILGIHESYNEKRNDGLSCHEATAEIRAIMSEVLPAKTFKKHYRDTVAHIFKLERAYIASL